MKGFSLRISASSAPLRWEIVFTAEDAEIRRDTQRSHPNPLKVIAVGVVVAVDVYEVDFSAHS